MEQEKNYICIDLKSFFASVECIDRGLDPMKARLLVADESRTDKTICLAVSPGLKAYGIPGRCRLFEAKQRLQEHKARTGEEVSFLIAPPQMARYVKISADIYEIYLKYIAPEDIHVYSIDEVFIDCRRYKKLYGMDARQLAKKMMQDVFMQTGITATAGVGTNLYLAKIAMDIVAKKMPADQDGARIAELDTMGYRELLWEHQPLTDFWQVGRGTVRRLQSKGLYTMGDIARCSLGKQNEFYNEELLFSLFGVNAELLIDHAWGEESCTMEDIKAFRPSSNSVGMGQVLQRPYGWGETKIIVREMTEQLTLDLVEKNLVTDALVLQIGYDRENTAPGFHGEFKMDGYGRKIPRSAHGTANLGRHTSSGRAILQAVLELFDRIVDNQLTVRRVNIAAIHVRPEGEMLEQMDLFSDGAAEEKEKSLQKTVLGLQKRYGKNTVLRGHDFQEGATKIQRNGQIGGHRA